MFVCQGGPEVATPETKVCYNSNTTAWLLVLALILCMTLPMLTRRGMFIDGIFFATISRNLAVRIGSVWDLQYSETFMAHFREHPPLAFVLESGFFRLLGDHYWVERLYSFCAAIASGGLIVLVWRQLARQQERVRQCTWLPILLWVLVSGWRGSYGNNVLEVTLGCFTLFAVYCGLRASEGRATLWLPLCAVSIVAAVYTKGPVGLFPLVTPAIACLTLRPSPTIKVVGDGGESCPYRIGRITILQIVLALLVVIGAAAVLLDADARQYMHDYWQQQVVASLSGRREVVGSALGRLFIIKSLISALLLPAVLAAAGVLLARRLKLPNAEERLTRQALFSLLTGLSASLPLAVSPKQLSFYCGPSWPFFALALALWSAPSWSGLIDWHYATTRSARRHRFWQTLASATMIGVVAYAVVVAGKCERDRDALADADAVAQHVPPHTTISLAPELGYSGALHAYLARGYYISASLDEVRPANRFRLEIASSAAADDSTSGGACDVMLATPRVILRAAREETAVARSSNDPLAQ